MQTHYFQNKILPKQVVQLKTSVQWNVGHAFVKLVKMLHNLCIYLSINVIISCISENDNFEISNKYRCINFLQNYTISNIENIDEKSVRRK